MPLEASRGVAASIDENIKNYHFIFLPIPVFVKMILKGKFNLARAKTFKINLDRTKRTQPYTYTHIHSYMLAKTDRAIHYYVIITGCKHYQTR